jgi:hypothetical protein
MRLPAPALLALLALAACGAKAGIRPFYTDGCSLFPDGSFGDRRLWCECCFAHDIAYWRGGTQAERKRADEQLRECVLARTGDERLADLMYDGVRIGGSPVFPNWYRWAYGWPYGRTYEPLTEDEAVQAQLALQLYREKHPVGYCERK